MPSSLPWQRAVVGPSPPNTGIDVLNKKRGLGEINKIGPRKVSVAPTGEEIGGDQKLSPLQPDYK